MGSAQDASRDQVLDEILVGPVPVGVNKFVLQADAPNPSELAQEDLLGVTVVLVTCSYKEREFVRVGYYVNNEYHDPNSAPPANISPNENAFPNEKSGLDDAMEDEDEHTKPVQQLPNPIPLEHIQRQILADKPRVTKFPISWGDEDNTLNQQQLHLPQEAMMAPPNLSDMVSMQEESNASYGNSNNSAPNSTLGGGLQAMAE